MLNKDSSKWSIILQIEMSSFVNGEMSSLTFSCLFVLLENDFRDERMFHDVEILAILNSAFQERSVRICSTAVGIQVNLEKQIFVGSCCSTVVEHTPRDR